MIEEQTFCFRVLTGERYFSGKLCPPKYKYQTIINTDSDFRRKMAYKTIEYLSPKGSNIIRIDHLPEDSLIKLLEYDQKKYG